MSSQSSSNRSSSITDSSSSPGEVDIVKKKKHGTRNYFKVIYSNGTVKYQTSGNIKDKSLLRKFIRASSKTDSSVYPDSDACDEWEVERLLDRREIDGQVEYLVQWKDWEGEPNWERENNLSCPNLIAAYENPKLRGLWNFRGSNEKLWLDQKLMNKAMRDIIRKRNSTCNLLKFQPNLPNEEDKFDLLEGLNAGALQYDNHWYLVIALVNHITISKIVLVADSLNTMIGTVIRNHPVMVRLRKQFHKWPIRPVRITQMYRSDMCAFYALCAFDRALFIYDKRAKFICEELYFPHKKTELLRSEILPESDSAISVAIPGNTEESAGGQCEFCDKMCDTPEKVDRHIRRKHFLPLDSEN